ncbi:MAG: hypothetical protein K6L73_11165 [Cellvibrionaceae bacterium]
MDTHALEDSTGERVNYSVGIIRTDLHSIALLSGDNLLNQVEDCIDHLNQAHNLDPSRTIYVVRDTDQPSLASQCKHLCPTFASGRCVDFSIRRLDYHLLSSVSEYLQKH